jgi:transposase
MLEALVAGTRDPAVLAELPRGKLRVRIPALTQAMAGRFGPTHALVVGEIPAHLSYLDEAIGRLTERIDEAMSPFATERDLLTTSPGADRRLAEAIIAEVGVDMTRFDTAERLSSWAGMCPGQHESAGKSRTGRARHGDTWLQKHLTVAAMAAVRTKDTYLSAQYARLVKGRGKSRARKAVGHSILIAVFHILASGMTYQDLGGDYFSRRLDPQRRAARSLRDLRPFGWTVTQTPRRSDLPATSRRVTYPLCAIRHVPFHPRIY